MQPPYGREVARPIEVSVAALPERARTQRMIRTLPTRLAAMSSRPASGPKTPPVKTSGPPCSVERTVAPTGSRPLTGKPKTLPWKKFQVMCNPTGMASLPVRMYPIPKRSPAKAMLTVLTVVALGLPKCPSPKREDEIAHARITATLGPPRLGKFRPSARFVSW